MCPALQVSEKPVSALRDQLEQELLKVEGTQLNGSRENRLPNISNISFEHINGEDLLLELCREVALSRGSACSSVTSRPSHVLKAMGLDDGLALSSFRMSLGRFTSSSQIEYATGKIAEITEKHRTLKR
jgi:cysteine desulfurase